MILLSTLLHHPRRWWYSSCRLTCCMRISGSKLTDLVYMFGRVSVYSSHLDGTDDTLIVGDTKIQQVQSTRPYLGVTIGIDQNLTFQLQVDNVINKSNHALGALKWAANYIPWDTRITTYNVLVLPHLDYCATIWAAAGDGQIQRLQKIQNRGMRIILKCPHRTHIQDMLSKLIEMAQCETVIQIHELCSSI